jgi:hypothetical protein
MIEAIGMKLMMLTNFEASMEGSGRKGLGTLFKEYASAYAATPNIYDFVSEEAAALVRAEFPFKPNAGMPKGYMEQHPASQDIYCRILGGSKPPALAGSFSIV